MGTVDIDARIFLDSLKDQKRDVDDQVDMFFDLVRNAEEVLAGAGISVGWRGPKRVAFSTPFGGLLVSDVVLMAAGRPCGGIRITDAGEWDGEAFTRQLGLVSLGNPWPNPFDEQMATDRPLDVEVVFRALRDAIEMKLRLDSDLAEGR